MQDLEMNCSGRHARKDPIISFHTASALLNKQGTKTINPVWKNGGNDLHSSIRYIRHDLLTGMRGLTFALGAFFKYSSNSSPLP